MGKDYNKDQADRLRHIQLKQKLAMDFFYPASKAPINKLDANINPTSINWAEDGDCM